MAREIKFRAKHFTQGYWVYGGIKANAFSAYIIGDDCEKYEVQPSTVGQYTGAKDRNGVEIYEGDILMFHSFLPDVLQERHLVSYCEDFGFCQIEYVDKESRNGNIERTKREEPYTLYGISNGIVIGNIHDNPDLLKGGDK